MDTAFDIDAISLNQAYDIHGNPLFNSGVQIVQNHSSGTGSGYSFRFSNMEYSYPLFDVVDFLTDSSSYQSFVYNPDKNQFYKFDASTTVKVYNSALQNISTITLPTSAGHTGDACYYDGKIFFPADIDFNLDELPVWDIENNTINLLPVIGIPAPESPVEYRVMGGICNVPNEPGLLYLVYADRLSNAVEHDPKEKFLIYKYNINTHEAEQMGEYVWDCVYLQGSTVIDGILYAACNSPTTGSPGNYTGITLKAFRTDTWEELQYLTLNGSLEPEGMDVYPYNEGEIMMGIAHYGSLAKATRFSAPYKLVTQN